MTFERHIKYTTWLSILYYADCNNVLKDFENYLVVQIRYKQKQGVQHQTNVRQIWIAVGANHSVFPRNCLTDSDLIEDYFCRHLYVSLPENLKLRKEEQSPHIQAPTITCQLCFLSVFCKFLISVGYSLIWINLTIEDIQHLTLKVQELCKSLKKSIDAQEKVTSKMKSNTLIKVKNFQYYGSSNQVKNINSTLQKSSEVTKNNRITKEKAIDIEDYQILSLTYFNCLRASNVMNITLHGVNKMTKHEKIDDAYVSVNNEYKFSII